jgi:hypothetical protein
MPSANGVYTLPVGYLAVTGTTIQASQHNPPLEDIAAALTARLSRDGTAPMTGPVQAAAGSAAAPSVTFAADNSKGLFSSTNGVGVAVGGAQVAEFTAAGLASGVWFPGMLLPWFGSEVPSSLWCFPTGQTFSRTAKPALWAFAQSEIAAGNAFFNNGDGSTTFGIGDCRGRTLIAPDNMGGTAAGILNTTDFGASVTALGTPGGAAHTALALGHLPTGITSTGSISVSSTANVYQGGSGVTTFTNGAGITLPGLTAGTTWGPTTSNGTANLTSNNTGSQASGGAKNVSVMQPGILCNVILFTG